MKKTSLTEVILFTLFPLVIASGVVLLVLFLPSIFHFIIATSASIFQLLFVTIASIPIIAVVIADAVLVFIVITLKFDQYEPIARIRKRISFVIQDETYRDMVYVLCKLLFKCAVALFIVGCVALFFIGVDEDSPNRTAVSSGPMWITPGVRQEVKITEYSVSGFYVGGYNIRFKIDCPTLPHSNLIKLLNAGDPNTSGYYSQSRSESRQSKGLFYNGSANRPKSYSVDVTCDIEVDASFRPPPGGIPGTLVVEDNEKSGKNRTIPFIIGDSVSAELASVTRRDNRMRPWMYFVLISFAVLPISYIISLIFTNNIFIDLNDL